MTVTVKVLRSVIAIDSVFSHGPKPTRLMAMVVHFPDIGAPVLESIGFLRYPGEAIQGDAEPVAPGPASNRNL